MATADCYAVRPNNAVRRDASPLECSGDFRHGLIESHAMTDSSSAFLAGRAAIVTGGSRGIGLATALALRAEGADVAVCGRSGPALDRAGARIEQAPGAGRVAAIVADIRRHDDAERLVTATVERFGGVDILINNAGVGRFAPVSELTVDAWVETIETNLSGVFYCCRAAIPAMKRRGGGWIVNVSSWPASIRSPEGSLTARRKRV